LPVENVAQVHGVSSQKDNIVDEVKQVQFSYFPPLHFNQNLNNWMAKGILLSSLFSLYLIQPTLENIL